MVMAMSAESISKLHSAPTAVWWILAICS